MRVFFKALLVLLFLSVCGGQALSQELRHVKNNEVCMVTNRAPGPETEMIPVDFDGRRYYGCCKVCVSRIKNEREVRYARDPLTGREVDKARAYILAAPGGSVVYFESRKSALEYRGLTGGSREKPL